MTSPGTSADAQLGAVTNTIFSGSGFQNAGPGNLNIGGSVHFGVSASTIAEAFGLALDNKLAGGEGLNRKPTNGNDPNQSRASDNSNGSTKYLRVVTNTGEEIWQPVPSSENVADEEPSASDRSANHDTSQLEKQDDNEKWGKKHGQQTLVASAKAFWQIRLSSGYEKTPVVRRKPKCTSYWCPYNPKWLHHRSPSWIGRISGPWNMGHQRLLSNLRCGCSKERLLEEQQPTQRPWIKLFFQQPSYRLSYALRPARILPPGHPFWGCFRNKHELFQAAVEQGLVIYPDDRSDDGCEVLEFILRNRDEKTLGILLDKWTHLLPQQTFSRRIGYALRSAWERSPSQHMDQLLMRIAPYVDDWDEPQSMLHLAVVSHDEAGVRKALEDLDDISIIDDIGPIGLAPIHLTAVDGQQHLMDILVQAGADVNLRDYNGKTPFMWAAKGDHINCMQSLIAHGCRVNDRTELGFTALDYAEGQSRALHWLLRELAPSSSANLRGETMLHYVSSHGNFVTDESLLRALVHTTGADPKDCRGHTPLIWAMREDNSSMATLLIKLGASLNFVDGKNILHYMAGHCHSFFISSIYFAKLSAQDGVDVEVKDDNGHTSWDIFLRCLYSSRANSWEEPYLRSADIAERMQFNDIFQDIRDRNLQHDITEAQQILEALNNKDLPRACFYLHKLIKLKKYCCNEDMASWYLEVQYEIEAGEVSSATGKLEDQLQRLEDKLKSSPWEELGPWRQNYLDERDYIESLTIDDMFA